MKSFLLLVSIVFSNLCMANPIPTSVNETLKLVIFENGNQMIDTPADFQISIFDWYLSTVSPEGNEDLTETGMLFSRISNAECTEQGDEVTCKIGAISQEFVPAPSDGDEDLYCTGADYGEGITVVFTRSPSKLTFVRGAIDVSMSGSGPCGVEWN